MVLPETISTADLFYDSPPACWHLDIDSDFLCPLLLFQLPKFGCWFEFDKSVPFHVGIHLASKATALLNGSG